MSTATFWLFHNILSCSYCPDLLDCIFQITFLPNVGRWERPDGLLSSSYYSAVAEASSPASSVMSLSVWSKCRPRKQTKSRIEMRHLHSSGSCKMQLVMELHISAHMASIFIQNSRKSDTHIRHWSAQMRMPSGTFCSLHLYWPNC